MVPRLKPQRRHSSPSRGAAYLNDIDTLRRFMKREGISVKKIVLACERDRPDLARRRRWWQRLQLPLERLVFVDETWTKASMTRTHGWWRAGEPLKAKVPHGHWRTTTFLAALRSGAITALLVLDGPINAREWLGGISVKTLSIEPGSAWENAQRSGQPGSAAGASNAMQVRRT
ncbi:MAG: hypothetical protein K2X43_17685 [Hyphomonadaceae bacterium]|jgi:hypothetical protein|nr:hypothetical protein [Hyphomonadaceae bacterium]